jgi:poly(3-hydroxybutyrate) depolymerase
MKYKGEKIDLGSIRRCALLTLEGENDDISAPGQTYAAHELCRNLPKEMHDHYLQPKVGHYGVFSGSRWRKEVAPKIEEFIKKFDKETGTYYRRKK